VDVTPEGSGAMEKAMDEEQAVDLREQYREIYRFVRRRSRSTPEAEDVTQEVFLSAAAALERFKPGSTPGLAWLYTVAERRLADAARRSARRREAPDEAALELVATPANEYGASVAAALARAFESLPLLQKQAVGMKLFQGLSFAEIAEATRSNEGTCRMRFMRGLEHVRDVLEREGVGL